MRVLLNLFSGQPEETKETQIDNLKQKVCGFGDTWVIVANSPRPGGLLAKEAWRSPLLDALLLELWGTGQRGHSHYSLL